ncbi:MAG: pyrimidine utilization protein B, partial [Acinetobacter calcoaceticus]
MSKVNSNVVCADFTAQIGTGKVLDAEPEAIQLAPEQTALIVIDMQNAYT